MNNKHFQYTLSNIDMKSFYQDIMCYYEDCPEVIVVDEIEDGGNVLRKEMENGNCLIYLKNSKYMFQALQNELAAPKAKTVKALPFENHKLGNEELWVWISCACIISDILKIRCPQIIFTPFENAGNAAGQGMLCLPDTKPYGALLSVLEMFVAIAHELRHEWQYFKHPDWHEDYVQVESDEDMEAYLNHKTEIDAEAFARKLAEIVFYDKKLNLLNLNDNKLMRKLKSRAQRINISVSDEDVEYMRGLFDNL